MKTYHIRIQDQTFKVEIEDLNARPVRVCVDGEWLEVTPEETNAASEEPEAYEPVAPSASAAIQSAKPGKPAPAKAPDGNALRAPIPGVITAVDVQVGQQVSAGQAVCALEAMKMNNILRAPRAGKISALHISRGQHVKHQQILMEFTD